MYINCLKVSLNVAYSDHSSGGVINFLEKIQGAYANYDHTIQQYGNGEFHIDSDKECIIHIMSLFKHSDENKTVYKECHNAIRQGKSFNDFICDLRNLYSYMTDALNSPKVKRIPYTGPSVSKEEDPKHSVASGAQYMVSVDRGNDIPTEIDLSIRPTRTARRCSTES